MKRNSDNMKIGASTLAGLHENLEDILDFIENLGLEYPLGDKREATKEEAKAAKNIILLAYKKAKEAK